jgi:4-hydroxybenzoate polyprenyltransferase
MFPLSAFVGTILTAVAVELVYLRLFGVEAKLNLNLIFPGIVLAMTSLLIRVMDEFKDYNDDLVNFPQRPLPSGRVKKSDLKVLAAVCIGLMIGLSATSLELLVWGLAMLAFTGLMYKWFFLESTIRKSLPLAFLTHHPIVIFNFIYLIVACMQMNGAVDISQWNCVLPICLMYTNWELARKIRTPDQETSYTTYSKLFGTKNMVILSLALQICVHMTVLTIFARLKSPEWLNGVYLIAQQFHAWPSVKYFSTQKIENPLKAPAEAMILTVVLFLLLAALL